MSGLIPSSTHSSGTLSSYLSISESFSMTLSATFFLLVSVIRARFLYTFNALHCFKFLTSTPANKPTFSTASLNDIFSNVINQLMIFPPTPQEKQ